MLSALKAGLIELFCSVHLVQDPNSLARKGHFARLLLGRADPDTNRIATQRFVDAYNFPLTRWRAEQLGTLKGDGTNASTAAHDYQK